MLDSFKQLLTPDCMKKIEMRQFVEPDTVCSKEISDAQQAWKSDLRECIDKRISSSCKKQNDARRKKIEEENKAIQDAAKKCSEAMQKMIGICGTGQAANAECYKNHREETGAACRDPR